MPNRPTHLPHHSPQQGHLIRTDQAALQQTAHLGHPRPSGVLHQEAHFQQQLFSIIEAGFQRFGPCGFGLRCLWADEHGFGMGTRACLQTRDVVQHHGHSVGTG